MYKSFEDHKLIDKYKLVLKMYSEICFLCIVMYMLSHV